MEIGWRRICPACDAANNGMQTHCLLCKTELPAVDRSGITPMSSLATRGAAPVSPAAPTIRASPAAGPATQRASAARVAAAPVSGAVAPGGSASGAGAPLSPPQVGVPGALPLSELLHRGPLATIGVGCVSVLILFGCAGCSLLALRFIANLR